MFGEDSDLIKNNVSSIHTYELNETAIRPLKTGFNLEYSRKKLNYSPLTLEKALDLLKK